MSFIYLLCRKNEKGAFWAKGQRKEAGERARRGEGLPSRGRAAGSPQRGGLPWARRAPVGRRAPPAPQRAPQRAGPAAACHLRPPLRHWLRSATCRGAAPAASAGSRGAVTCGGAACPPAPMRRRSARAEPSAGRVQRRAGLGEAAAGGYGRGGEAAVWGCGVGFGEGHKAVFYFFPRAEGAGGLCPQWCPHRRDVAAAVSPPPVRIPGDRGEPGMTFNAAAAAKAFPSPALLREDEFGCLDGSCRSVVVDEVKIYGWWRGRGLFDSCR